MTTQGTGDLGTDMKRPSEMTKNDRKLIFSKRLSKKMSLYVLKLGLSQVPPDMLIKILNTPDDQILMDGDIYNIKLGIGCPLVVALDLYESHLTSCRFRDRTTKQSAYRPVDLRDTPECLILAYEKIGIKIDPNPHYYIVNTKSKYYSDVGIYQSYFTMSLMLLGIDRLKKAVAELTKQ